jgi:hypothetical protein
VTIETYVEERQKETFIAWMTELTNGKSRITEGDVTYLEEDVKG